MGFRAWCLKRTLHKAFIADLRNLFGNLILDAGFSIYLLVNYLAMSVELCNFISIYNTALKAGHRTFFVPNTQAVYDFVLYLYAAGYILGYHCLPDHTIRLYPPAQKATLHELTMISRPSRSIFFSVHRVRRDLNAGLKYWVRTPTGVFCDSYQCCLEGRGGLILARFSLRLLGTLGFRFVLLF
jgi:ribosomal protein S8